MGGKLIRRHSAHTNPDRQKSLGWLICQGAVECPIKRQQLAIESASIYNQPVSFSVLDYQVGRTIECRHPWIVVNKMAIEHTTTYW